MQYFEQLAQDLLLIFFSSFLVFIVKIQKRRISITHKDTIMEKSLPNLVSPCIYRGDEYFRSFLLTKCFCHFITLSQLFNLLSDINSDQL